MKKAFFALRPTAGKEIRYILLCTILSFFFTACTINFKGKDVEFESKPAEPDLNWSQSQQGSYQLDNIEVF